ncbi:peptidylprolyl isomerase [Sphingomonas sp. PB4P5]|uniref:peptidylprolyl isomerase n=1 Tax=Parasphingomonas puruogangriensis TaxID=3096155 RepID=UPI002FCB0E3A
MKAGRIARVMTACAGIAIATVAVAQTVEDSAVPAVGLNIPDNMQVFGKVDPNVRKPTAIVNDTVITGTDVDQRVALIMAANPLKISDEDKIRLRTQILNQLIDEALQIQEAKANDITIPPAQITSSFNSVAKNFQQTPEAFRTYLRKVGSSERSMKRQIEGELAWSGFLRRKVEPSVNVGEEEVASILKRMQDAKGTEEYHVAEIYLSATPDRADQVFAAMRQMIEKIQKGEAPFGYFARNFSEASTKAVDGDLGWVRTAQLPDSLSKAAATMQTGQIAGPIEVPGGFSLLYLVDKRQVLTADPRDARLALKQLTVSFPAGTSQAQATARVGSFATAVKEIKGCGDVAKIAATLGADVVDRDAILIRDLPPALQQILLQLQVGEATPPFGSAQDGVRALVVCGRDEPRNGELPNAGQLQGQMEQQRVNLRAQQMLRDLRRDAIVEYR